MSSSTHIALSQLRQRLEAYGFRPSKGRGQNFLFDPNLCASVVDAAGIQPGENVLEIGTGCGHLTAAIARKASRLITVEIDPRLSEFSQELLRDFSNIEFILGDFLDGKQISERIQERLRTLPSFIVIANLPYSVGGTMIGALCSWNPPIPRMLLTVQREVAERIVAPKGSSDRGPLSLLVQLYYQPKLLKVIPPSVFWPKPQVESALLRLERNRAPLPEKEFIQFQKLVPALFQRKRKQVGATLRELFPAQANAMFEDFEEQIKQRPQDLELEDFLRISALIPC